MKRSQTHSRGRRATRRRKFQEREGGRRAGRKTAAANPGKASRDVVDDTATRRAAKSCNIVCDVSFAAQEEESRDGRRRSVGEDADTKNGFELRTARVGARGGDMERP